MALTSIKQIKGGNELMERITELEAQVKVLQNVIFKYHSEEANNTQPEKNNNAIRCKGRIIKNEHNVAATNY